MTKQNHTVATHADPERIPLPPRITPFTVAGLYIIPAVLWIIFSDYFVDLLIDDPQKQFVVAMAKGLAFVTFSGLLIFYLVSVSHRQLLRATREARNRGEILRNITENCTAAYFRAIYTNDGKFELIDASSGYLRLTNAVPLRSLTSLEAAMACYHQEDRHRLIDTLRAASLSLVPLDLEARLLIEPGIARWFRIQAAPLKLDDGSIRWDGVLLDIDARLRLDAQRRVAMALHERVRDRLEALLEAAIALQRARDEKEVIATTANGLVNAGWNAVVVSTLDAELRVINESIAGAEQQAILPKIRARTPVTRKADFILNSNDTDKPRRAILNYTEDNQPNWRHADSITIPLRDNDSGIAGLIDIAQPADGARPNEDDIRFLETFADLAAGTIQRLRLIQRQHEAERRRHESERRLALHIRETPLAYVESDLEHVITYFNPAAEKLFGWKAAEVVGKATWHLLIPEYEFERVKQEVDAQAIGPDPFRVTNNNITRDGQEITCVWYNTPLVDDNGVIIGLSCMGDDITAQREYERKIKQALATQRLLTTELDHRVKNALGSLLNLIDFSTQSHTTVDSFAKSIRTRVDALSKIHAVLSASSWQSVELRELITLMIPPDSPGKLSARGPETHIAP
ncbi:MAG: PAS domain S-box protein, partial [Phycisphaeraceae bacterium]